MLLRARDMLKNDPNALPNAMKILDTVCDNMPKMGNLISEHLGVNYDDVKTKIKLLKLEGRKACQCGHPWSRHDVLGCRDCKCTMFVTS